jgi:hypothetical protein
MDAVRHSIEVPNGMAETACACIYVMCVVDSTKRIKRRAYAMLASPLRGALYRGGIFFFAGSAIESTIQLALFHAGGSVGISGQHRRSEVDRATAR